MRSDARRNRDRLLAAAREEFAAQGRGASLNRIAQQAGVGPGTLYRHFPSAQALLVAIISEDVAALCARGEELLAHPSAGEALRAWLRALAVHASAMRGLVAVEALGGGAALAECHDAIRAAGSRLLRRAEEEAGERYQVDIDDLLVAVNAMAWAGEQAPQDHARLDRLLALLMRGLPSAG
ncbi:TetR/AcrR family transcriptional regulator [Actinoplanes aureus]|uniref:TetR/AcrR family transcriptional regulator n=1 Tax=Actinoplanes aureus TaxID=2792083 RepID=A0A931C6L9_9ACTN|nr:TetR/AcrR family transcriptional regulator [Actinoplanes aureus]MBG0561086.1 TetR/AcrR family transcriptional regulator [Actinoplanes aureus]